MKATFILIILFSISCRGEHSSLVVKSNLAATEFQGKMAGIKKTNDVVDQLQKSTKKESIAYFQRSKIHGDFNGDGLQDTLYESMLSHVTGKQIDSVQYKNFPGSFFDPYSGLVDAMCNLKPTLKLKSTGKITSLKLNHTFQVFGILEMQNLGNINSVPGDEIALIVDWADWSNVNTCEIFSLSENSWSKQFSFETREPTTLDQLLQKRKNQWYYYFYDALDDKSGWRQLNLNP